MNHLLSIIALLVLTTSGYSQTERPEYKSAADRFEQYYNADQFDQIFNLFSSDMQHSLPLDQTQGFLSGLKKDAGNIEQRTFITYHKTYASYKTHFEQAVFTLSISLDTNGKINGLFVKPYKDESLPKPERNTTALILPFKDEWTVIWGGDTKEQNYHVESEAQKNAFDIVITDAKGNSFRTDGKTNEDYYAFGKEIIAPCDAEVVLVVDGVKDNVPGVFNPIYVPGNTVIIKAAENEYLFFAHFKQHTIKVKQGEKVKQGQVLGLCGNTGNSSEPHIHFHIQNVEDMTEATGVKCYFSKLMVNGNIQTDYSPVQHDKIKNVR